MARTDCATVYLAVTDVEDWSVDGEEVPYALVRVELDREAAGVAHRLRVSLLREDARHPHEDRRLLVLLLRA